MNNTRPFGIMVAIILILVLSQCKKDSIPQLESTDSVTTLETKSKLDTCLTCPVLKSVGLQYFNEKLSSQPDGHFFFNLAIQNDYTQYTAVPIEINLFNLTEGEEIINITDDPQFEALLSLANIPLDTMVNLVPFTDYCATTVEKFESGFYNKEEFCDRCDSLYTWPTVPLLFTKTGECIAPDSLSHCLLGSDICTMMSVTDILSFSFFPQRYLNPISNLEIPAKENLRLESPYLEMRFAKQFINGDVEFTEIPELDTMQTLSDCPIFRTNDGTIPERFSVNYDFESEFLKLDADWEDNDLLTAMKVSIITGDTEFGIEGDIITKEQEKVTDEPFNFEFPELAKALNENPEVVIVLDIVGQNRKDIDLNTINRLTFTLSNEECRNEVEPE